MSPHIEHAPPQEQAHQPGRESEMHPQPEYLPKYPGSGRLKDKVVIISGGDSGIGRAVSVLFAREGARVAIVYRDEDKDAEDTADLVEAAAKRCCFGVTLATRHSARRRSRKPSLVSAASTSSSTMPPSSIRRRT